MKKLTKTQKQNLKKKLLRTFNIIGLIVGGLSFIVVLYAIIAGSLNSNNSDHTTAESLEVVSSTQKINMANTPPSSYDLELSAKPIGPLYYFFWTDSAGSNEALFSENIATIDYYQNIKHFRGLTITTNVYAPTTPFISRPDDMFLPRGEYFGSAASSPAFRRFFIMLDNYNSAKAFLFYGDFCTSGYNVLAYTFLRDNGNPSVSYEISPTTFLSSSITTALYIPPFSRIYLYFIEVSTAQYLDALYIDDIGSTAYDTGFNDGYTEGYDDAGIDYNLGYADGVAATTSSTGAIANAFDLIYAGAASVDKILSISIFGSITLGMLLFTPLIIGISLAVIKIIKG